MRAVAAAAVAPPRWIRLHVSNLAQTHTRTRKQRCERTKRGEASAKAEGECAAPNSGKKAQYTIHEQRMEDRTFGAIGVGSGGVCAWNGDTEGDVGNERRRGRGRRRRRRQRFYFCDEAIPSRSHNSYNRLGFRG